MANKHNGIISFWKFMFCLMIIALHLAVDMNVNMFRAGSIGVEFFFIVSGFLLGKNALNQKVKENEIGEKTCKYILKKVTKLFPYMLFSYIFAMVLFTQTNSIPYSTHDLINSIWDLLFFRNIGIKYRTFLGVSWYISAMLVCMIGLYPLILKQRDKFIYITAPLIVILGGGYIANFYQSIANNGNIYISLLRALFELSLGTIIYSCSKKINKINFTKFGQIVLSIIEFIGFSSIFFVVNIENAHIKYDFIMILILSICICIAFSEKTILYKYFNNKLFYFLEKISLPMYLNQYFVMGILYTILQDKYLYGSYYVNLILVIIIDIITSILIIYLIKFYYLILNKTKKLLIKEVAK